MTVVCRSFGPSYAHLSSIAVSHHVHSGKGHPLNILEGSSHVVLKQEVLRERVLGLLKSKVESSATSEVAHYMQIANSVLCFPKGRHLVP